MLTPALIGGIAAGVLSGIPFLNCLCCLWVIGGAMLATYLMVKDSPAVLTPSDGVIVGVFTGIIAVAVRTFLEIAFRPFYREFYQRMVDKAAQWTQEMPPGFEGLIEGRAFEISVPYYILGLFVSALIFAAFGALGGILGISLFGKKAPLTPPGDSYGSENTGDHQS